MRFMLLMIPSGYESAAPGTLPEAEAVAAMMSFNESLQKAGVLLALDGLHPPSMGARASFKGGRASVADGPFADVNETLGGYWMIQVKSKGGGDRVGHAVPRLRQRGHRDPSGTGAQRLPGCGHAEVAVVSPPSVPARGSLRVADRAGPRLAAAVTVRSASGVSARVIGSDDLTSNRKASSSEPPSGISTRAAQGSANRHPDPVGHDHRPEVASTGAEGDPDAELFSPLPDDVGEQAVDARQPTAPARSSRTPGTARAQSAARRGLPRHGLRGCGRPTAPVPRRPRPRLPSPLS